MKRLSKYLYQLDFKLPVKYRKKLPVIGCTNSASYAKAGMIIYNAKDDVLKTFLSQKGSVKIRNFKILKVDMEILKDVMTYNEYVKLRKEFEEVLDYVQKIKEDNI